MERNIVSGASGFLGKHLTERLESSTAIPHKSLSDVKLPPFDNFFFLSTYGNMANHVDDAMIRSANLGDLIHVLQEIQKQPDFKSFIFVSSSSVKLKRQTMYSRCKRAAEEILLAYMEKYNAPICIVRPFSITGVGEQPEHLIPKLIDSCLNGTRMDLAPVAFHDFIDVDDVVDGILNLSKNQARGIFELGTGQSVSNLGVLKLVEKITGKEANVDYVDKLRDYDTTDWQSENFKARMFGWLPKKSLEDSITEMVKEAQSK